MQSVDRALNMSTSTTLRLSLADFNRMVAEDAFRALGRRRIELI